MGSDRRVEIRKIYIKSSFSEDLKFYNFFRRSKLFCYFFQKIEKAVEVLVGHYFKVFSLT